MTKKSTKTEKQEIYRLTAFGYGGAIVADLAEDVPLSNLQCKWLTAEIERVIVKNTLGELLIEVEDYRSFMAEENPTLEELIESADRRIAEIKSQMPR